MAAYSLMISHMPWRVSAWLEYLATANGAELPGATGTLRLDAAGHVRRTPTWAAFSNGIVVPLTGRGG